MTTFLPLGMDGGDPGIITAKAISVISGGQFVAVSGASNVVNISGAASFDPATDVHVGVSASGALFTGIATQTVASGGIVPIATRGAFVVLASATVTAGTTVGTDGADGAVETMTTAGHTIGRALTTAGSGYYAVVLLEGRH